MNRLARRMAALIEAQGPLSVSEFMTMALHDPSDGYYATREPFGAAGDFITAPEISQVFGEFLGLWCVQVWHDQGRPARKRLVELGPGRGTLMADALRAARVAPEFLDDLEVVLVEASPALAAIQRNRLGDFPGTIRWVPQFDDSLADRPLFLLANEFFDALPIRQFVRTARGWCERMVIGAPDGALDFALAPGPVALSAIPPDRREAPEGGVYEVSPPAFALCDLLGRAIADKGGGALIIDYGYDRPGFGETLQAVAEHAYAAILDEPGESDLSAHVDFPALADRGARNGLAAYGPVTQAAFLEDLGAVERIRHLAAHNPASSAELWSQLDRLVSPEQMGTLFKALALVPRGAPVPPGF